LISAGGLFGVLNIAADNRLVHAVGIQMLADATSCVRSSITSVCRNPSRNKLRGISYPRITLSTRRQPWISRSIHRIAL
jgi:hypothetical protein